MSVDLSTFLCQANPSNKKVGIHALHVSVAVKSLGSDFPQALGSVLPLSFVHLPIVLSDPVLAYPAPGR